MLPFKPTEAQKRVLERLRGTWRRRIRCRGFRRATYVAVKTIVAAEAAVIAIENGYQVAMLAPTEILATQHYFYWEAGARQAGLRFGTPDRLQLGAGEAAVEETELPAVLPHIAIGTHALLQEDVDFHNLGLAVIDEQHRFGVLQRLFLARKGAHSRRGSL